MPRFLHWLANGQAVARSQCMPDQAVEIPAGATHLMISIDEVPATPQTGNDALLADTVTEVKSIGADVDDLKARVAKLEAVSAASTFTGAAPAFSFGDAMPGAGTPESIAENPPAVPAAPESVSAPGVPAVAVSDPVAGTTEGFATPDVPPAAPPAEVPATPAPPA